MSTQVWISIQSDYGLTMGELGGLSSSTDSTLIASTLMALKDVVSIEASSGESQFMTGAVESSSFGTFAIPINEQSKLVLSYIISASAGETIDDEIVKLSQSLCNHLGKQLTQFSFLSVFVTSGAVINRTVVTKAFINACTLVRMEYNLPSDERSLQRGYEEVISSLLSQKDEMLMAYNYILGDDWRKNYDRWFSGILTVEDREKLHLGLSEYIVFLLANKNPLLFLHSPNPRYEQKKVQSILTSEIRNRVTATHEPIIEILPDVIKSNMRRFIGRLSIADVHRARSLMFDQFVQDAYIQAISNDPLVALVSPKIQIIQSKFTEILPSSVYESIGNILQQALTHTFNDRGGKYISSFYNGFIKELSSIKLSSSSMAFLITFAQQFLTGKQLRDELDTQQNLKKSWLRDISKHISVKSGIKSIKQLKVDSINEAVQLTNAAGYSIVNTIATILADQFLITNGKIGFILENMISFYHSMGGLIKASSAIVAILEHVAQLKFNSDLITPLYQDLIGAVCIRDKYQVLIEDSPCDIEKKKDSYYLISSKQQILLLDYLHQNSHISLKIEGEANPLVITLSDIDVPIFNKIITTPDIITSGIQFATERRFHHSVTVKIENWMTEIEEDLNKLNSIIEIENNTKKVKDYVNSQFQLPKLQYVPNLLDDRIDAQISDLLDEFQTTWDAEKRKILEILDQTKSLKKERKKIIKITSTMLKQFLKSSSEIDRFLVSIVKEVFDASRSFKKQLKDALDPTFGEVLSFRSKHADSLLISKDEVIRELVSIFQDYEEFNSDEYEKLLLSVSLTLFDNPPEVLLDYAYNEVISGQLSQSVKLAVNQVDSKEQFEQILKSQANEFAANIFRGLTEIIARINQLFIARDGMVTTDGGKAVLQVGTIPLSKFPKRKLINDLLTFKEINFTRETNAWSISLQITDLEDFESEEPTIVTFSDAVGYIHRTLFNKEVGMIFEGLANVASMIEPEAEKTVTKFYNNLVDSIFSLY
ncbi:MAG: hypothetical protein ACXAD7_00355 [Candidatus Kariarchaeaceae archaeon]|jgi:hypothetical protein